jgi:hypothetical protein
MVRFAILGGTKMRRNFMNLMGIFWGMTLLFSSKVQAEDGSLEEKFRPQFDANANYEEDADLDLTSENVLKNGKLVASRSRSRDGDNAVDRAFGKMDKRRARAQRYKYWYLLPFGIPQFTEGYRGIGSAFAVGQVGSLALYYDRMKKVESGNAAATDATRNLTPQQAAQNPFIVNFLNANEKAVEDAQKEQRYFLYAFIGLYGLSVYEALYDPLDMRKLDVLRNKKRRDRDRDSDRGGSSEERRFDDDDDEEALNDRRSRSRFGFMVLPTERTYEVAMSWQMTLP